MGAKNVKANQQQQQQQQQQQNQFGQSMMQPQQQAQMQMPFNFFDFPPPPSMPMGMALPPLPIGNNFYQQQPQQQQQQQQGQQRLYQMPPPQGFHLMQQQLAPPAIQSQMGYMGNESSNPNGGFFLGGGGLQRRIQSVPKFNQNGDRETLEKMGQANSRRQRAQQQSTNPNVPPEIILKMTQLHNQQYGGGLGGVGCEGGSFVPGPVQPFGPGPASFGPGPAAFGPGPAAFGPGPAAFGPGPVAFGPGPGAFGPGPLAFGPGPVGFGPGPVSAAFGPGPVSAAFGPGPVSAAFGPGPGSAVFGPGPGSAAFGPGSSVFGPGSAAFGPGSAAFGPGSAAFGPFQSYPGPAPTFGPSQAFGSFASGGGLPALTSFAPHHFNSPPQLPPPAPAPFALTQGPSNGSALTQVAPPAPIYKHVSTVVQYSNNPNEFVGGSAAASAPGPLALPPPHHSSGAPLPPSLPPPQSIQNRPFPGPNVQYGSNAAHFGSNYSSGGVLSNGGFSVSAPSAQLSFPSPSQYYGSTQGPNGYSGYFQGSGYSQYPGSYTLNGSSGYFNNASQAYTNNFNNGSQAYTNNLNNGSQAYTNNFNNGSQAYTNNNSNLLQNSTNFSNQQQVIDSTAYENAAVNATANATTSNPYGHYSNNFSAAFPDSSSSSGHNQAGPSMTITTTNGGNGGNVQDSNLLNLPSATSQTEVRRGGEYRRAQHSTLAPPKQIVVYRPSIHKSKQRFTVVA